MVMIHRLIAHRLAGLLFKIALLWGMATSIALSAAAEFAPATVAGGRTSLTLTTSFNAATTDIGRPLRVYLVALVPTADATAHTAHTIFARTAQAWLRVDAMPVPPLLTTVGTSSPQPLPVVEGLDARYFAGTLVYLGYGMDDTAAATAFDEMIQAGRYNLIHTVATGWNDSGVTGASAPGALQPVSAVALTEYFRTALGPTGSAYLNKTMQPALIPMPSPPQAGVADSAAAAPAYSGTTLQEAGVDEADLIKSDGSVVFSLDAAGSQEARRDRVQRQRLNASTAELTPVDSLKLPLAADVAGSGLYLDSPRQQLVAIAQAGFGLGVYDAWFSPLYWSQGVTEAVLIDAANPEQMQVRRSLRMSGQLIGSRRVGATLYLVLRSYPTVVGLDPWWPTDKLATNQSVVASLQAPDLLPTIAVDGGAPQALVDAASCFIQPDNAALSADIITIVGIDLAAAEHRHAARCFTGGAEAFYMSEQSLYLATTRSSYSYSGKVPVYADQSSTDLHKFSLDGLDIIYRGSGNVTGHLGFDQNRKSFRMGEYQDMLRVITQSETRFGGWVGLPVSVAASTAKTATDTVADSAPASPGQLSILQERAGTLALIGQLPNAARPAPLGKPGEQLYASRFIGERGYLVTYRLTDPLYVLDLATPTDPKIAGELEISGYSDYLFPLDENLLLGVGKDAMVDGSSGDGRFAWYQGVKISLIDVTDPAHPRESARALVGQRGTDATVLHDHHGIALQTLGRKLRIGLPVSLHDTPAPYASGKPNDYFLFTRTELQRFEIDLDTQSLSSRDALKSSQTDERSIENDRSLLWGDQVHYYQNGNWLSAPW